MHDHARLTVVGLALALGVPQHASAAVPKEFRTLSSRADAAAAARDYEAAGRLFEQAYGALADDERVGTAGTDVVLDSIAAREQAFHRDVGKRDSLVAGQALLERHLADIRRIRPEQSTAEIERRLEATCALLGVEKQTPAAAATEVAGPWMVLVSGQRIGPLDRAMLAEAYLSGDIDDTVRIIGPSDRESVELRSSSVYTGLDQWYLGRGSKWLGPMSRDVLRKKLDDGRAEGHNVDNLQVRLAWSKKTVIVRQISALLAAEPAGPVSEVAVLAAADVPAPRFDSDDAPQRRDANDDDEVVVSGTPQVAGGAVMLGFGALATATGIGLAAHRWQPVEGVEARFRAKVWAPPLAVGLVTMAAAVPFLIIGVQRNRKYREHRDRVAIGGGATRTGVSASVTVRF